MTIKGNSIFLLRQDLFRCRLTDIVKKCGPLDHCHGIAFTQVFCNFPKIIREKLTWFSNYPLQTVKGKKVVLQHIKMVKRRLGNIMPRIEFRQYPLSQPDAIHPRDGWKCPTTHHYLIQLVANSFRSTQIN